MSQKRRYMNQNFEDNLRKKLYSEFENTPLWIVIEQSLCKLEQNKDLEFLTPRKYVVEYICNLLTNSEKGVIESISQTTVFDAGYRKICFQKFLFDGY